ncbi:MAG: helix-turn-helix domain-containing protein [Hyphomonas sp.]
MDVPRAPEGPCKPDITAGPVERLSALLAGAGYPTVSRRLAPHEHLYFEQDPRKGVYELLSGTVIQYALLTDARRRIESFARPGDLLAFGQSAFHDENVEALTEARLNFIPRTVFDSAMRDLPGFRDAVLVRIEQMLREARSQSALIGWKSAAQRTASFLLFLEERFRDPVTHHVRVPMTRRDIADYLGLTIETVSRMISRLKESNTIHMPSPGDFVVLDHAQLVEAAGDREEDGRQMRRNRA